MLNFKEAKSNISRVENVSKLECRYHLSDGRVICDKRGAGAKRIRFMFPHPCMAGVWCVPLDSGKLAWIDESSIELLCGRNWYHGQNGYAYTTINHTSVLMHSKITGFKITDHRSGNRLDNRSSNLREATYLKNNLNRARPTTVNGKRTRSQFKGVVPHWKKFCSYIRVNGVKKFLGSFPTEIEAALAYDEAAREIHGEFYKPQPGLEAFK